MGSSIVSINTEEKRRAALNFGTLPGFFKVSPKPSGGIDNQQERRHLLNSYYAFPGNSAVITCFDARVMNRAISQSDGEATNDANLGTVHYTYDDMRRNSGKVTLPYG